MRAVGPPRIGRAQCGGVLGGEAPPRRRPRAGRAPAAARCCAPTPSTGSAPVRRAGTSSPRRRRPARPPVSDVQVAGRLEDGVRPRAPASASRSAHAATGTARPAGRGSAPGSCRAPAPPARRPARASRPSRRAGRSWPGTQCRTALLTTTSTGPPGSPVPHVAVPELQPPRPGRCRGEHLGRGVHAGHPGAGPPVGEHRRHRALAAPDVDDDPRGCAPSRATRSRNGRARSSANRR